MDVEVKLCNQQENVKELQIIFSHCRSSTDVTQGAFCHMINKECSFCLSRRKAMTSGEGSAYILNGGENIFMVSESSNYK